MMNDTPTIDYEDILKVVRSWPFSERLTLVQDILSTLAPELEKPGGPSSVKRNTLKEALGLLAINQPAPSDQDIEKWLNEYRVDKYS